MASLGRVLIADDEGALLLVLTIFLRREGYECDYADDTKTVIEMLSSTKYDLLITDISMHGNSETEPIKNLSEIAKSIPVIMMTGNPSDISKIHSIKQKEKACILKPFEFKELLQQVRVFIK